MKNDAAALAVGSHSRRGRGTVDGDQRSAKRSGNVHGACVGRNMENCPIQERHELRERGLPGQVDGPMSRVPRDLSVLADLMRAPDQYDVAPVCERVGHFHPRFELPVLPSPRRRGIADADRRLAADAPF